MACGRPRTSFRCHHSVGPAGENVLPPAGLRSYTRVHVTRVALSAMYVCAELTTAGYGLRIVSAPAIRQLLAY